MGTATAEKKSISQLVVEYAATHVGHVVGTGECWDLAFYALQHAHAKTPYDLGTDLYVWGTVVPSLSEARPGDILQFEGVKIQWSWVISAKNVKTTYTQTNSFPHHTAIVRKVEPGMFFTLLHANVSPKPGAPLSKKVHSMQFNLSAENIQSGTITVYRPIPK